MIEDINVQEQNFNRIGILLDDRKISNIGAATYLEKDTSTISKWKGNTQQPSLSEIDRVADFLEINNCELIINTKRQNTGLAEAIDAEYKRLTQIEKLELKVDGLDDKGKLKKVTNPELIKRLQDFAAEHIKAKSKLSAKYFDKQYDELTADEISGHPYFICNTSDEMSKEGFNYLVVTIKRRDNIRIGQFALKEDAERFVEGILKEEG